MSRRCFSPPPSRKNSNFHRMTYSGGAKYTSVAPARPAWRCCHHIAHAGAVQRTNKQIEKIRGFHANRAEPVHDASDHPSSRDAAPAGHPVSTGAPAAEAGSIAPISRPLPSSARHGSGADESLHPRQPDSPPATTDRSLSCFHHGGQARMGKAAVSAGKFADAASRKGAKPAKRSDSPRRQEESRIPNCVRVRPLPPPLKAAPVRPGDGG